MPRNPRPLGSIVLPLVLCMAGCRDSGLSLYGECVVGGRNYGKHMEVSCHNSPFAERPDRERAVTARKVAEYVRDHHVSYGNAQDLTVTFWSKKETAKGDFKHPRARYTFTRAELGEPPMPVKVKPDTDTSAADSAAAYADSAAAPG